MKLATIGYEAASIEDFLATLEREGVSMIVDVRELPISRKRGFAKTRLSDALQGRGIQYVHFRALGDPKPGREAARRGDYALFREIFSKHLKTECAREALRQLEVIAKEQSVCLMCYEKDPQHCHRSIVAARIERRTSAMVRHLQVNFGSAEQHDEQRNAA